MSKEIEEKKEVEATTPETKKSGVRPNLALGISLGMLFGISIGSAMDNLALGMALGTGFGCSIGLILERRNGQNGADAAEKDEEMKNGE